MKNISRKLLNLAFLVVISTGIAALKPAGKVTVPVNQGKEIEFLSPVDGDMLNEYDGTLSDGSLFIKVRKPS